MGKTIAPRDINGFNAYVNDSTNYLLGGTVPPGTSAGATPTAAAAVPANYIRLGLTDVEMNTWRGFRDQWNLLYPKYTMKAETRTTAVKNKLRDVEKAFITFSASRLRRMSGSENATKDDAAALRFTITRKSPTRHVTPIADFPEFSMTPLGSGDMKFRVRPSVDSKRSSHPAGTEIEFRYQILFIDEPRPTHIDDMTKTYISTKASFVFHCGTSTTGKFLWAACRFIVANDPSRNGPWSSINSVAIA